MKFYIASLSIAFMLFANLTYASSKVCIFNGNTEETASYVNLFAKDQGLFNKSNIELEIKNNAHQKNKLVTFDERINEKFSNTVKFSTRDCDFLVVSFEKILKQKEKFFNDYQVLFSSYYGTNYDTHFIVKKDSQIKSIADLKGKSIRLGQLGAMLAFKKMAETEKLEMSSIKLLETSATIVQDSLTKNKIAMGTTYFPTMQVTLASGEVEILKKNIFGTYLNSPYPQSIILVSKHTLNTNPQVVSEYKKIIENVLDVTKKSPMVLAKTLRVHAKELGMDQWNITDAQIERGEENYQTISFVNGNESVEYKGQKLKPSEIFHQIAIELKSEKLVQNDVNFSGLFN